MKFSSKHGFGVRASSIILSALIVGTSFAGIGTVLVENGTVETKAATVDYGLADNSQDGVILHCWNWSYNNIKKYMKDIAAAGYTSIQTSPVTQPKDYYWEGVAYGNVGIPDGTGDADHGNWWKVYQPVTMSICDNGYTWFGTKEEFKAMCDEAEKYGVRVIVDIVANHMGNIQGWKIGDVETVMGDISPQVGEFWEPAMLTDSSYWHISDSWVHSSDGRYDVTQGNMGMPDLNTGDSKVQQMVLNLLKECIDCGADGFRFDAAKHIETPADDPAFASSFWDVVLDGARDYYKKVNGYDGIFFYGEILNRIDDANAEAYYRSVMSLTDNSTSDNMRNSAIYGNASGLAVSGYCGYIAGEANRAVLWAESHDTYMGGGSSYDANDDTINQTWAIVGARKDATALYFARPYYSKDILANDTNKARQDDATILKNVDYTQMGDVGSLTWASPSVVAVNRFHNFFVGQSEKLGNSGSVAYIVRGNTGIVLSKLDGPGDVSISVGMKDGTYKDQVSGNTFTVSGGVISGTIGSSDGIAVVYNPTVDYGPVNPEQPTVLKISASTPNDATTFTEDTIDVTMTVENAVSATYTTTEGDSGSFTGSKTITVGSTIAGAETVSVTITATAADGTTKSKTYTYTKKGARTGYPTLNGGGVVFDNANYHWSKVYAYVYDANKQNNAAWPGVKMTEVDGDFFTYEFPSTLSGTVYVIFNDGSGTQFPTGEGLEMLTTDKKLFVDGALTDLPQGGDTDISVTLSASAISINVGESTTLTAKASDATGSVSYQFALSDGTVLQNYSSSSSYTWTPTKAGTYKVVVTAKDAATSKTATSSVTITVKSVTTALTNNSTISATSITKGKSITLTGNASGGTSPYQYAMVAKHSTASSYTVLKNYDTTTTKTWTPSKTGTYYVQVKVKDSNGTVVAKSFTLKVQAATTALTNNSTISATSITKGKSVTMTGKASGGTSPYQYAMVVRHSTASSWTTLKGYNTTATKTWTPAKTGTYTVQIKVKDAKGTVVTKSFTLTVKDAALTNSSTISATSITKGSSVTMTGKASGGTSPYQYAMVVRHSTASSWTTLKGYNTTATKTWTPAKTGTYTVQIKVKDASGTAVTKTFTLTVK
ncbi:MAG: alpha-amylase family glycosyl hydrolase [Acutalibacteraceae bacterium]